MPEHDSTHLLSPTSKALEALLFAAPGLSSVEQLSQALNVSKSEIEKSLEALSIHLAAEHGLRLQKIKNQYQMVTAPEHAELIEKFLGLEVTSRLTQAALEVLAIVAYKQPTTRPEIDSIRGVNSDGVVKSLLAKGLIEELGRSEAIGRPILYGVTNEFFQHFGLESLDQLPEVDLEGLLAASQSAENEEMRLLKD
ncbi:MAG: SMC-Scp complex subunit ScpB [Anaerolineaceae bacterium]|jgi:segregation and condensation protein B|nr:SMC-Scp complex subunit ScpB [Anaerolineaceae bacterium]MDI9531419.1 SMC-Scp complex subunit ScpB [Chloroflexota bacterium]HNZ16250.1 SMC-Scp complex subunit ScpB [Anaerolineaceae bacterium]